MYITARAALEQVDPHYCKRRERLGALNGAIFREVALPLAWPGVLAGTILSFARALGEFGATLMLAGDIPGKTETIPIAIYFAVEADEIQRAHGVVRRGRGNFDRDLLGGLYYWTHAQGSATRALGASLT